MTDALPDFDLLWDYDAPAETEAKFRALLDAASQNQAYRLELLTQIARTQGLQRKFDEAHQTLDEVEKQSAAAPARVHIRYFLERGRVFNSSKRPDQARPLFLEAWELASARGEDFYAVDAAHMMGIVEPAPEAMAWNLKALALAERSTDERARKWRGSLCNNIGWTYHDEGKYTQALDMFQRALSWREASGTPKQIRIARWCVARALRSLGRLQDALEIQRALLAEHQSAHSKDGYVYEEIGECLLALNQVDEARPYLALAYEELSQDPWLVENEEARLVRLKGLAGDRPPTS
jgi:tetratricopeptide (TPR) repeat protein